MLEAIRDGNFHLGAAKVMEFYHQGFFTGYFRAEIVLLQTMEYLKYLTSMCIDIVCLK